MGPINLALLKLFEADQKYREAQAKYDAAARDVRIQNRRVSDLFTALQGSQLQLKEQQTKVSTMELDIKIREEHIEKLRVQQQTTKNSKEYQSFLVQISTEKVDKTKAEDELLKTMGLVEQLQQETVQAAAALAAETQKLDQMTQQITERLALLQKGVDTSKPARDAAFETIPHSARDMFERLAERFDGEAMAPISRPDKRVEEYACGACNMSMAVDLYNRLHTRDEVMTCPSCRRLLYIPDDLPPTEAIKQRKKTKKQQELEERRSEPAPAAEENSSSADQPTSQA